MYSELGCRHTKPVIDLKTTSYPKDLIYIYNLLHNIFSFQSIIRLPLIISDAHEQIS